MCLKTAELLARFMAHTEPSVDVNCFDDMILI